MNTDDAYLTKLSKELRRHNVSKLEIQQIIMEVQETLISTGSLPIEEFGTAEAYAQALYPDRKKRQYYLATLIGIILAAVGFIMLNVYFLNQEAPGELSSLWKFFPLLAMPFGMLIDFLRYLKS